MLLLTYKKIETYPVPPKVESGLVNRINKEKN